MRIYLLVVVLILFASCRQKGNNKNPVTSDNVSDTVMIQEILGYSNIESTSFIMNGDTVLIISPDGPDKPLYYYLRNFFYDSKNKRFKLGGPERKSSKEVAFILSDSSDYPVYLGSIRNPGIKYSKLSKSIENRESLKKIITATTKIHFYKEDYYFMDKIFPQAIYVYEPTTDKLISFDIREKFFEVTDFLLYDIDKDGNAEIIIFNIGSVPREEVISYSIYSIRTDSVNVNYN